MSSEVTNPPEESDEPHVASGGVAQDINWMDFRDHLATADQQGKRVWLYPRQPQGRDGSG